LATDGVNARIWGPVMPPGPGSRLRSRICPGIAASPPARSATTQAKSAVPTIMIANCTTSVFTTLRRPPVVE
jgi:hypothetical protein